MRNYVHADWGKRKHKNFTVAKSLDLKKKCQILIEEKLQPKAVNIQVEPFY